jgi:hypothetical protein
LLGEAGVAALGVLGRRADVERRSPVGLGADPTREAEVAEPVGGAVERLRGRIGRPGGGVVADELLVRARDQHIRVGGVPLASPKRLVAYDAEVIAEGGHAARIEPEDVGIEGFLGGPRGLGHSVQRRVVAGIHGRAARRARDRRRVVALEVDAVLSQGILGLQVLLAERLCGLGLVNGRVAHLIAHEDQEDRPVSFGPAGRLVGRACLVRQCLTVLEEPEHSRRGGPATLQEATARQLQGGVRCGGSRCIIIGHALGLLGGVAVADPWETVESNCRT